MRASGRAGPGYSELRGAHFVRRNKSNLLKSPGSIHPQPWELPIPSHLLTLKNTVYLSLYSLFQVLVAEFYQYYSHT